MDARNLIRMCAACLSWQRIKFPSLPPKCIVFSAWKSVAGRNLQIRHPYEILHVFHQETVSQAVNAWNIPPFSKSVKRQCFRSYISWTRLNPKLDVFYVFHEHFPLIIRLIPVFPMKRSDTTSPGSTRILTVIWSGQFIFWQIYRIFNMHIQLSIRCITSVLYCRDYYR